MNQAESLFRKIGKGTRGVKEGKMFGCLCLKIPKGKSVAMLWKGELVVKLPKKELEKALLLPGTKYFEPMENRPMKEWVQVPVKHSGQWQILIGQSINYVNSMK